MQYTNDNNYNEFKIKHTKKLQKQSKRDNLTYHST